MGAVWDRGCRPQNALAVRMAPTAHAVSMVPTAFFCCPLLLLLVAILAVLGVFVTIFFGTIILQKVIQSRICLVEKREEARRLEVRDLRRVDTATMRLLAARPELVQVELEHISAEGSGDNAPLIPTQALIRP